MSRIADKNAGAKQQRGGQWSPRLSALAHPKRPVVGHLRFATRAKAISEAESLSRKIIDGDLTLTELLGAKAPAPVLVESAPTVNDLVATFIAFRAGRSIKQTTHKSWLSLHKSCINTATGIGDLDAATITVPQAHNFLANILTEYEGNSRMKQVHTLLRLSFSHAVQTGALTTNPLRDLERPASRAPAPRAYPTPTWAIMAALVRVLTDRRSILMVLLLMWAGLRYSELASLHREDVDPDKPVLHVRHNYARDPLKQKGLIAERKQWQADKKARTRSDGKPLSRAQRRRLKMPDRLRFPDVWTDGQPKGGKPRDVQLPMELWRKLLEWIDGLDDPSDPRFPLLFPSALSPYPQDNSGFHASWNKAIDRYCAKALEYKDDPEPVDYVASRMEQVQEMNPHHLRGAAASFLSDAGTALPDIRDLMGHSSVATTERYYLQGITDDGYEPGRANLRLVGDLSVQARIDAMFDAFEAKYFFFGIYHGGDKKVA